MTKKARPVKAAAMENKARPVKPEATLKKALLAAVAPVVKADLATKSPEGFELGRARRHGGLGSAHESLRATGTRRPHDDAHGSPHGDEPTPNRSARRGIRPGRPIHPSSRRQLQVQVRGVLCDAAPGRQRVPQRSHLPPDAAA